MNKHTKAQRGSPSRDLFKWLHKQLLDRRFYAVDCDLELISKTPVPFIVARIDFKTASDGVTFAEAIAYNELVHRCGIPVYIIEAAANGFAQADASQHRFNIYRYKHGDWRPSPPVVDADLEMRAISWSELGRWEDQLRRNRGRAMSKRQTV